MREVMMITGVIYDDLTADVHGTLFLYIQLLQMKWENVNNILFFIVIRFCRLLLYLFLVHISIFSTVGLYGCGNVRSFLHDVNLSLLFIYDSENNWWKISILSHLFHHCIEKKTFAMIIRWSTLLRTSERAFQFHARNEYNNSDARSIICFTLSTHGSV